MAPLPPLPDNNTACYFITMSTGIDEYTQQIRCAPDFSVPDLEAEWLPLFDAIGPTLPVTIVTGVRYRAQFSSVSLPVVSTLVGESAGTGAAVPQFVPRFISFLGRSALGRRSSIYFYGSALAIPADYRYAPGENADIDAARAILGDAEGWFLAKDNIKAALYGYANTGFNSYKERRQRT